MTKLIKNKTFDEERVLYNLKDAKVVDVEFKGPKDGESVLKETRNCTIEKCFFALRYPLWHARYYVIDNCSFNTLSRAPIWYCYDGVINQCIIESIKAVRECQNLKITNSKLFSSEFGWKSKNIEISDSEIDSEYLFFDSKNVTLSNVKMHGKYSFQYMTNLVIENSYLDTKDAFWHTENVTVKNSLVKGEYLGWFSKNLTLIDCQIIGTQPLCYCEDLKLINCTMKDTDLSFEYSSVNASVNGHIDSIKNPKSGIIVCDSYGELIKEDDIIECIGKVICK